MSTPRTNQNRTLALLGLLVLACIWFWQDRTAPSIESREAAVQGVVAVNGNSTKSVLGAASVSVSATNTIFPSASPLATNAFSANQISDYTRRQIEALERDKEMRNIAQQKLDSQLIYANRVAQGGNIVAG